ncbi:rhomboid family intramembrane serine protease [Chitinophaga horti]|uniref:Rhomboid family intramembrane serine protease n=1 Tax=Chitinophaga horti TaxID=2920382 RepID=A0ABY6J083_9BACT|nr:rhomboid family intramembrane serine protease [Chitinophaga horti]UYQ92953.1 rhomboid family intramembrane serine protease [Chitinophaga horti]
MIGFPPRAQSNVYLDQYTPDQYLALTWMAMELLGWDISNVEANSITAITPFSFLSFHDRVVVNVSDYEAEFSSTSMGMQIIDFFKNRKNLRRLTETIASIAENKPPEQLQQEFEARRGQTREKQEQMHITASRERIVEGFFSVFKPVPGYQVTPILITLNVLIYFMLGLTMVFTGNSFLWVHPQVLVQFGADYKLMTLGDQPWRLFSAVFMHASITHIFFNMYILMVLGVYLERIIGSWRFLAAYLICGFAASTTSIWWNDLLPSVGASGAIYGLIGVLLAMLSIKNLIEPVERQSLLISILITVVADNLLSFITGSGIDHGAHYGGLIFGFVLTRCYYYAVAQDKKGWLKKWAFTTSAGVVAFLGIVFFFSMKFGADKYKDNIVRLESNEAMASTVSDYTLYGNGRSIYGSDDVANKLKNFGIYYFDQNLALLEEMRASTLSPGARRLNTALKEYYGLYKQYYEVQYLRVKEGSYHYNARIDQLWEELESEKIKLTRMGWGVH